MRRDQDKSDESTRMRLDTVARFMLLMRLRGIHRNKEMRFESRSNFKARSGCSGCSKELHFSVQPVPAQNFSPHQGCFSYFQLEFPFLQHLAVAPCPIVVHLCEESGFICSVTLLPSCSVGSGRLQLAFASPG